MALGDALGLPAEGMKTKAIVRRFGALDRFRLFGRIGFVSDDTELTALTARALLAGQGEPERVVRAFRRAFVGWFWRLPFGIGFSTLKAALVATLGIRRSGRRSAGNGAAMRAAPVGLFYADDASARHHVGRRLAEVTHVDARAVEGALFVAELALECARADANAEPAELVERALPVVDAPELRAAIELGWSQAASGEAAANLGIPNTGYVVHSLQAATFAFARWGREPLRCLQETIRLGGDTDTIAAIVGGWVGGLGGTGALPSELIAALQPGPFGGRHLRALARALVERSSPPGYSALVALVRNLALYPVILSHGLRRLWPG